MTTVARIQAELALVDRGFSSGMRKANQEVGNLENASKKGAGGANLLGSALGAIKFAAVAAAAPDGGPRRRLAHPTPSAAAVGSGAGRRARVT